MCDTFVALPDATLDGSVIFGKNSDRPNGEIQDVVSRPARSYRDDAVLDCTWIQIPQTSSTLAVVLSKPRWMWGAEMGANESGVVIGNEAVWTTEACKDTGLLGMDLLRLGLERGESALAALEVIVALLGRYGQGGNCAEHAAMNYHNSFIIADKNTAWVLETAGNYWVAEKVISGTRSISNGLSIRGAGDLRHPDLDEWVRRAERSGETFDFARHFSEGEIGDSPSPYSREGRVRRLCQLNAGRFDLSAAQSILRDHQGGICMHGEFETRGSQISSLTDGTCQHWLIEEPFPCEQAYRLMSFPVHSEEQSGTSGRKSLHQDSTL
jgi:secernin